VKLSRREFSALASSALAVLSARRAFGEPLRVRRNVNALSGAEIEVFRTGLAAMRALPVEDFRSRQYQSNVHGIAGFPDTWPDVPGSDIYWSECRHESQHFLPWHRWYLLYWEEIVRELSGNPNFNAPYWDSVSNGLLPVACRIPADASNPLYNGTRVMSLNNGTAQVSGLDITAMNRTSFLAFAWQEGGIEEMPHNPVHNQVGGEMAVCTTAGLDPLFFMHHVNVDRYWECWLRMGGGRANPGGTLGWIAHTFPFQTLAGPTTAAVANGLRTADLGYTYDACPFEFRFEIPKLRFFYWLRPLFRRPPFPDPPPAWERVWLMSEAFALDGRDMGFVLPRKELDRAKIDMNKPLSVVLQDVVASKLVSQGGFFVEAWLAPDTAKLPQVGLEGAVRIGNFGSFELSVNDMHGKSGHQHDSGVTFDLALPAVKLLEGKADPAVVFVRRGIVDGDGKPIAFDEKAQLFKVGALALVSRVSQQ